MSEDEEQKENLLHPRVEPLPESGKLIWTLLVDMRVNQRLNIRDPRVLVSIVPNRNSNASRHSLASANHCLIVGFLPSGQRDHVKNRKAYLLRKKRVSYWQSHPDINLGKCHIQTQSSERVQGSHERRLGWNRANDQMALEPYTVERNTRSDKALG